MKAADLLAKQRRDLEKNLDNIELSEYFEKIPAIIQERTKQGSGISDKDGRKRPLKKLKDSTIAHRRYLQREGRLSPDTSPKTSNAIQSGQMLASIKLVRKTKKRITIEPTGKRDDGMTNKRVSKYYEDGGRTYLGLTAGEKTNLDKNLKKAINDAVKDAFN